MHNKTGYEYVAGLWKEQLPSQLLWAPWYGKVRRPIGSVPSWSWVSIDGRVSERWAVPEWLLVFRSFCQIEKSDLQFAGDDPYGEVLSRRTLRVHPLIVIKTQDSDCPFMVDSDIKGFSDPYASIQFCLPVCELDFQNPESSGYPRLKGLLLESVPGIIRGRFHWVGLFTHDDGRFRGLKNSDILADQTHWAHDSIL